MSVIKIMIAGMTAASLALATAGCATSPGGTTPVTGQSNIAQIAAQALAICKTICGVVANAQTVSDIQVLVQAYLSAGAFTTATVIANVLCDAVIAAKANAKLRGAAGALSVTVTVPQTGEQKVIHFAGVR